jgi:histidinol phosphatase-like enzyme
MDGIIIPLDEALTQNNFEAITSILQSCSAVPPIKHSEITQRTYDALFKKNKAAGVLLHYLKANHLIDARKYPPGMVTHVLKQFTTQPSPSIFVGELSQPALKMIDRANYDSHTRLFNKGGIRRPYSSTKSIAASNKIERTIARLAYMNTEQIQKVFVDVQKVFLLNIITELVEKKQHIGADTAFYIELESVISSNDPPPPTYDMHSAILRLIHEYIIHKYNTERTRTTTSDELLNFIRHILPVLSASMSSYYGGDKDSTDFNIYLPLLANYIELVLIKNYPQLVVGKYQLAVIIGIISQPICDFVRIAGVPVIYPNLLIYIKNLIITGVSNFLSRLLPTPAATPAPDSDSDGGSLNRNRTHSRTHSRIKKYKNRTKYRTNRGSKYRTNRYKIKNKKTRKVYKY